MAEKACEVVAMGIDCKVLENGLMALAFIKLWFIILRRHISLAL